ncbi:MAG: 50S ribosomal protein L25 [Spirochaetales bacterium]|nr:50S ribosomal protein L25 [Spirochaetales bacterium]
MENKTLEVKVRDEKGKSASRALRREGMIPSIIYGHREPVSVSVSAREFNSKFKIISESIIIDLNLGKETYHCIVKDYQENAMRGTITHIDFYEIEKGKSLKTHVPVHVEGAPLGVKTGGIFETALHELEIECLPKDLPEMITVNVSSLEIGQSIHVADLKDMPGIKFLTPKDALVCAVVRKKEVKESGEGDSGEAVVSSSVQSEE